MPIAILKPGLYQARNMFNPQLVMFHFIEFIDNDPWVYDVPNPRNPTVMKRKRRLEQSLRDKLEPITGGVNDRALLPFDTPADRKADDPTIHTQEELEKAADEVAADADERFTHLIDTAPEL